MIKLDINFIFAGASMAGGVKSGRLLAEAISRRGHNVRIFYPRQERRVPPLWRLQRRAEYEYLRMATQKRQKHHLESSSIEIIPVDNKKIDWRDIGDADFSIANFWLAREWMERWPERKGIPGLFVRGHFPQYGNKMRIAHAYKMPGLLAVHAHWLQEMLMRDFGATQVVLAPNGVDRTQFFAEPRSKNMRPRIGFQYGRSKRKGAHTILEAVKILRARGLTFDLVAFGSERMSREHRRQAKIVMHVRPSQDDIPKLYGSCDCWVVPSEAEGLPMPGLEAAACCCPIVATRCGGPEDYVDEGQSGVLVPVNDAEAMAEAIRRVITAPESEWQSMSAHSFEKTLSFDWDDSARKFEQELLAIRNGEIKVNPCRLNA